MRFSSFALHRCCVAVVVIATGYFGTVTMTTTAEEGGAASVCSKASATPPFVHGPDLMASILTNHIDDEKMRTTEILGCCGESPDDPGILISPVIGTMPQMTAAQTLTVLQEAETAWEGGSGTWPQMSFLERLNAIEAVIQDLETNQREKMVHVLMWEIGKNRKDAEAEFDRTMQFGRELMRVMHGINADGSDAPHDDEFGGTWKSIGPTMAFVRRAAIGIILCLGPMNYPLNETYATLIPALLMGNIVLMKVPTVGGLVHFLTIEAFRKALPKGAMNFITGRGRETMPVLMETGKIDGLAFIGGSNAADRLIKQHPHPHRLKLFLQLEAKNMGIFLPDILEKPDEFSKAIDQAVLGALSYNGQRCTALKLFFIPKGKGEYFSQRLAEKIDAMHAGLPWQSWNDDTTKNDEASTTHYSHFTPLPDPSRIELMKRYIDDAVSKGAKIVNKNGGTIIGGDQSTLMIPAVLYPVTPDMDIYYEEQFGPVVPIAEYDSLEDVIAYGQKGEFGQQVSIFVSEEHAKTAAKLLDLFSNVYGKININSQCGRSPDTLPFSGRRSSAMGVMSVRDALREFSIPTVVSYKSSDINTRILQEIEASSTFLQPLQ